jgi:hypothetical protein
MGIGPSEHPNRAVRCVRLNGFWTLRGDEIQEAKLGAEALIGGLAGLNSVTAGIPIVAGQSECRPLKLKVEICTLYFPHPATQR